MRLDAWLESPISALACTPSTRDGYPAFLDAIKKSRAGAYPETGTGARIASGARADRPRARSLKLEVSYQLSRSSDANHGIRNCAFSNVGAGSSAERRCADQEARLRRVPFG